ncbi:ABC transporter permease [Candidatus Bipolaricaulota bacterium]|nr:ABC transporter permease [Candidatus Bipolaricaulota bacterium]
MRAYLAKRFLFGVLTLLVTSLLIFSLLRVVPGGPVDALIGEEWDDPELRAQLRRDLGLDLPFHRQYARWLGGLFRGDLGVSLVLYRGEPVGGIILERFGVTAQLAFISLTIALLVAFPAGIAAALWKERLPDHVFRIVALGGISTPNFFLGIALIVMFGVGLRLKWGVGGYVPFGEDPWGWFLRLLLPAIVLGTDHAATISRMLRASILEALGRNHVLTAKAMGLPRKEFLIQDVLRTAMVPVVTVIGNSAGALLDGAVITEILFRLPGLGSLLVQGVYARDLPLVQSVVIVAVGIRIAVNLIVDLSYALMDPRIRYGRGQ